MFGINFYKNYIQCNIEFTDINEDLANVFHLIQHEVSGFQLV